MVVSHCLKRVVKGKRSLDPGSVSELAVADGEERRYPDLIGREEKMTRGLKYLAESIGLSSLSEPSEA